MTQITALQRGDRYTKNMDMTSSAPFTPSYDPGRAHWIFWELGLLAALAAIIATPAESNQQALLGILSLLFLMGLSNHLGKETP